MAAPMKKHFLTFCKIKAFHRTLNGNVALRGIRSISHPNRDLTAKQREKNSPDYILKEDGQWKKFTDLSYWHKRVQAVDEFDPEKLTAYLEQMNLTTEIKDDMPVDMPDPYVDHRKKCILCEFDVKLDYKNTQLLSQFVSPFTGRMYGRNITGLCLHMQRRVAREILISKHMGFMPYGNKLPEYMKDPMLYNPFKKT